MPSCDILTALSLIIVQNIDAISADTRVDALTSFSLI